MSDHVFLTVGDHGMGYGIFPRKGKDLNRRLELRARSVLAYGYTHGHIKPFVSQVEANTNLVLLDREQTEVFDNFEYAWPVRNNVNTGCIYIADNLNVSWADQPGRMALYLEKNVPLDLALRSYFQTSLRWMEETGLKAHIAHVFESSQA
jgi:hypothetical protein